ncbi:MAG: hypothetical protein GKR91_03270 [Pseudomonadales bacterium]|nr:hypothetical protein [Pseudomonadales bacterium]
MNEEIKQQNEKLNATQHQLNFSNALGLDVSDANSLDDLISMIETRLGQDTMLEQARWFIVSVLRHGNKDQWQDLSDSGISEEQQYELAQQYISSDDLKQSLRTVLKDNRCRFTLLRFAKSRNLAKRTLSTTTKAYKQALVQLKSAGLVTAPVRTVRKRNDRKKFEDSDSVVNRRAARRGYFDEDEVESSEQVDIQSPVTHRDREEKMSEEEYAELEEVIEGAGERAPAQNWSYPTNEDRLSLLMGLAAGGGVFVIVLLLFL